LASDAFAASVQVHPQARGRTNVLPIGGGDANIAIAPTPACGSFSKNVSFRSGSGITPPPQISDAIHVRAAGPL
jgi:hypothetical protein